MYDNFDSLQVRPFHLIFIIGKLGAGCQDELGDPALNQILSKCRDHHQFPITLRANVSSIYLYQNPGREHDTSEGELINVKRDLDIIQALGLVPGSTRPAEELFERILKEIPNLDRICGLNGSTSKIWGGQAPFTNADYLKGVALGLKAILPEPRTREEMLKVKEEFTKEMYQMDKLAIRPHHLMCMSCYHAGRDELEVIEEDQLFEMVNIIQKNPEIPVTLVEGCCMLCPPCHHYQPETNLCIREIGLGLRDEKKDLEVLELLDLKYGDTLPAYRLYEMLFDKIEDPLQVCGFGDGIARNKEWSVCPVKFAEKRPAYEKARACGLCIKPCSVL